MATLLLSTAGAVVGGLFGGVGAVAGRATGALAGYAIDQALFGGGGRTRTVEGSRLSGLDVQSSSEGAAIPRVYGRARIAGQMIWATRFEEVVSEERSESGGGKGGGGDVTITRTYRYFANFALGLCEGPVAGLGRVWADGKPLDLSGVLHRLHTGTEDQSPDSLIEAKEGSGAAPAYRGLAYVVFERLPLESFGNRIPQLSFEVIRPVAGVERMIRAVTLIPGATEFGYDPEPVFEVLGPGAQRSENRHVDGAASDWQATLDQMQAVLPALESVSLVVSWFGDDLRAGHCRLRPAVERAGKSTAPYEWSAAGLTRATAPVVSSHAGRPAYGGTPADASVIRAIADLRSRGLKVMLSPFVMMDVPAGNALPDPYDGDEQAAHPWRGRITASVAPGLPGSPDRTPAAADEVGALVGTAAPGDFSVSGGTVAYAGPDEWSLRRMVLHMAHLCVAAGGVDAFLLGSELRGLTTLRSGPSDYPFVAALRALAADVRTVLGPETAISYGADWSEYSGHWPDDGSGDVHFHLDPFWADANVDFVGIDNYLPLADWRDGPVHLDGAQWDSGSDIAYLRSNMAGGEGFDWFYASQADRAAQVRTPIADGAYGKPWVFRVKDLTSWWQNQHVDRPAGVETGTPTAWVPMSKPIRFTEIGCPAVDKGPNQPNVFPDPKSAESALPHFSNGLRDDLVQRRFIAAACGWWDEAADGFAEANNPVSPVYGGRMVDAAAIHWWTFDARPYPAFPYRTDRWSDGVNWETGHWLSGRLGALGVAELVAALLADNGFDAASIEDLDGVLDGYLVGEVMSARDALEPLARLMLFDVAESGAVLRFVRRGRRPRQGFATADLAAEGESPLVAVRRAQETELPSEMSIGFSDPLADFRAASVASRRLVGGSRRTVSAATPAVLGHAVATGLADAALQDAWAGRETLRFALPPSALALEAGDIVTLDLGGGVRTALVTRIEEAGLRRVEARTIEPDILSPVPAAPRAFLPLPSRLGSVPEVLLLDLPLLVGSARPHAPRIAAFADPWPGAISVAVGTAATGFASRQSLDRRATMGELLGPLAPGPAWRWDRAASVDVVLYGGTLASEPDLAVLNGANAAAVGTAETGWEIVQFRSAELVGERVWRLSGFLRGQAGTADMAAPGHAAGARFVLVNGAVPPLAIGEEEAGLALTLRCGPVGEAYDPARFVDLALAHGRRGLRCLAPVQARARREETGDVAIAWTRQTRIGGDPWEPAEIPLGEAGEAYLIELLDGAGAVWAATVAAPAVVVAAATIETLFGGPVESLAVRIRQISPTEGPGFALEATLDV